MPSVAITYFILPGVFYKRKDTEPMYWEMSLMVSCARHIPLYQSSMFHLIYRITQNLYILFIMAGKYDGFSFFL